MPTSARDRRRRVVNPRTPTQACATIRLSGPPIPECQYLYGVDFGAGDQCVVEPEKEFLSRLATSFMTQIGSLVCLHGLSLNFRREGIAYESPFLELTFHPTRDLPQLQALQNLKMVVISGLPHNIGQKVIEWMKRHWPRLISLEVPILRTLESTMGRNSMCRATCQGQVTACDRYFSRAQSGSARGLLQL